MISDRGRSFLSNLVKDINQLCQTSHLLTAAYHPQTNGLTERMNKTLADMLSMAEEARQLEKPRILDAQAADKRRYDERHRPVTYNIGDLVWVFTPVRKVELSETLLRHYFGPYRMTRRLSDVTYEAQSIEVNSRRQSKKDIVHVLGLKPYCDPKKQLDDAGAHRIPRRPVTWSQTRLQRDADSS
ncbi:hypothetical protein AVEN_57547-1 [Araneus ventricosus]|uniref:Integrase catalytic domain-containing protein n=1 Tax=Araneus ventricosus TaxID=182803 RepID=A0A4Y2TKZ3_ARAVE|nr:hypothetical protein AVEN_57547-1 [Araneus ventricosus]